jgi:hypothetical protein
MRLYKSVPGLSLACALSLACGGTFCEEYPEACGAVPVTPFDVEVSLLDGSGQLVPATPVLVSDLSGKIVELQFTGADAPLTITVPGESYVSVFYNDTYAFTALATPDTTKLTFQLPAKSSNPKTDIQFTGSCSSTCPGDTQLSVSCRAPVDASSGSATATATLNGYVGCAGSTGYDAFLVGYDTTGLAKSMSSQSADLVSESLVMPTMAMLGEDQRFDFQMNVDAALDFESVTRSVRVPYTDRPGYGFSRVSDDPAAVLHLSLVTELVPRAQSIFLFSLADERSLLRQQLFDPVPAETTFVSDIAIPARAPLLGQDDPSQPVAAYSLGEGRLADALQLNVEQGALTWVVSLPADANGKFSFPDLPPDYSSYLLSDLDDYDVLHLDLDDADGYASFVQKPILDYGNDAGTGDLTIARSSR